MQLTRKAGKNKPPPLFRHTAALACIAIKSCRLLFAYNNNTTHTHTVCGWWVESGVAAESYRQVDFYYIPTVYLHCQREREPLTLYRFSIRSIGSPSCGTKGCTYFAQVAFRLQTNLLETGSGLVENGKWAFGWREYYCVSMYHRSECVDQIRFTFRFKLNTNYMVVNNPLETILCIIIALYIFANI